MSLPRRRRIRPEQELRQGICSLTVRPFLLAPELPSLCASRTVLEEQGLCPPPWLPLLCLLAPPVFVGFLDSSPPGPQGLPQQELRPPRALRYAFRRFRGSVCCCPERVAPRDPLGPSAPALRSRAVSGHLPPARTVGRGLLGEDGEVDTVGTFLAAPERAVRGLCEGCRRPTVKGTCGHLLTSPELTWPPRQGLPGTDLPSYLVPCEHRLTPLLPPDIYLFLVISLILVLTVWGPHCCMCFSLVVVCVLVAAASLVEFPGSKPQAQDLWYTGLVALRHGGSSQTGSNPCLRCLSGFFTLSPQGHLDCPTESVVVPRASPYPEGRRHPEEELGWPPVAASSVHSAGCWFCVCWMETLPWEAGLCFL